LFNDPLGTATIAMNATSQAVSRQEYTPFGETITSTNWPDSNRGYLGKPTEAGTGYTDLGARKYDPALGRFISADPALEPYSPQQLGGYTYAGDNPVASSDPTGLMICVDGGPCGSIQAVTHYETVLYNNEAQAAENQSINQCGYHMGCVMAQVRDYKNPVYVQAEVQNYDAQQAYIAEEQAAQAAAEQRAQQARAHSGGGGWFSGLFHAVTDVVSFVAPIATIVAVATCAIPGVDVITGGIALGFDLASGALNTYGAVKAFSSGDTTGGILDTLGAVLSFAGAGVGGRAVQLAMDARAAQKGLTAAVAAARTVKAGLPDTALTAEQTASYWSALKSASVARRAYEVSEGIAQRWANFYGGLGGTSLPFEALKLAKEANDCQFGCG
jgi:RHS repeat-associated protein